MTRTLVAVALAAFAALAGCLQPIAAGPLAAEADAVAYAARVAFEDAAGDAHEFDAAGVVETVACHLPASSCKVPLERAPAPHFDILGVAFAGETDDTFRLELTVASLGEGFPELAGPGGHHRAAFYAACWVPGDDWPTRCATLEAHASGVASAALTTVSEPCNEWWVCAWNVPVEFTPGAPARIAFEIPKAYATHDGAPPVVAELVARVSWWMPEPGTPAWHAAYTVRTPSQHLHHHLGGSGWGEVADVTESFPAGVALRPTAAYPAVEDGVLVEAAPGTTYAAGSAFDVPYLDILRVELHEDAGDLVVTWTLAEFEGMPDHGFHLLLNLGIEGKEVWEAGFLREGAEAYGYAGHCISYECDGDWRPESEEATHGHDDEGFFATAVPHEILPGKPGKIVLRIPVSTFPSLEAGDRLNVADAASMYADGAVYVGKYGDATTGDVHKMSVVDAQWGARPYVFRTGNAHADDGHEH